MLHTGTERLKFGKEGVHFPITGVYHEHPTRYVPCPVPTPNQSHNACSSQRVVGLIVRLAQMDSTAVCHTRRYCIYVRCLYTLDEQENIPQLRARSARALCQLNRTWRPARTNPIVPRSKARKVSPSGCHPALPSCIAEASKVDILAEVDVEEQRIDGEGRPVRD